jgi:hypothetical protein
LKSWQKNRTELHHHRVDSEVKFTSESLIVTVKNIMRWLSRPESRSEKKAHTPCEASGLFLLKAVALSRDGENAAEPAGHQRCFRQSWTLSVPIKTVSGDSPNRVALELFEHQPNPVFEFDLA